MPRKSLDICLSEGVKMANQYPALSEQVFAQVDKVFQMPKVQKALEIAKRDVQLAMDEQVELCEIPSPTFHEEKRRDTE